MELVTCNMCGLDKVPPMHETDIGVGILTDYGSRICEDCYEAVREYPGVVAERDRLKLEISQWESVGVDFASRINRLGLQNAELAEALTRIADGFDGYNSEDWQAIVKENRQVAKDALSSHQTAAQ